MAKIIKFYRTLDEYYEYAEKHGLDLDKVIANFKKHYKMWIETTGNSPELMDYFDRYLNNRVTDRLRTGLFKQDDETEN